MPERMLVLCLYWLVVSTKFCFPCEGFWKIATSKIQTVVLQQKTASNSKYQSIPNHDWISIFHTEIQLSNANNGQTCAADGHYTTTNVLIWLDLSDFFGKKVLKIKVSKIIMRAWVPSQKYIFYLNSTF